MNFSYASFFTNSIFKRFVFWGSLPLRFKNQWSYIFSGQITQFEKYKYVGEQLEFSSPSTLNLKLDMTLADVLVEEGGKTQLYSGTVVDYDLCPNDTHSLERIYLRNAFRFKVVDGRPTEKKEIPGDLYVLETKKLLNINLTYVPSEFLEMKKDLERLMKEQKSKNAARNKRAISLLIILFVFFYVSITLFTGSACLQPLEYLKDEFNICQKIWFILTMTTVISIIFYDKDSKAEDPSRYKQSQKGMWLFVWINVFIILYEVFFESIYNLF